MAPPYVPTIPVSLRSWLPAPISQVPLDIPDGPDVFKHLVWGALAGLGVGVWHRAPKRWRWAGPALVVLVIGDHAAHNYQAATSGIDDGSPLGDMLSWPFLTTGGLLGWWPLVGLAAAVLLDRRSLRGALGRLPQLWMTAATNNNRVEAVCLAGYSLMRPPWTAAVVHRFVLIRRSAAYAADTGTEQGEVDQAAKIRELMASAATRDAWRVARPAREVAARIRDAYRSRPARFSLRVLVPVVIWLVLAVPVAVFYRAAEDGSLLGVQTEFFSGATAVFTKVILFIGLAWTGWRIYRMFRAFGPARHLPFIDDAARLWFTLCTTIGSTGLGLTAARAVANGADSDDGLLRLSYFLGAWLSLLLITGIVLIIAAIVLCPALAPAAIGITLTTSEALLVGSIGLSLTGTALYQASTTGGLRTRTTPGPTASPTPPNPFEPPPWAPWLLAAAGNIVANQFPGSPPGQSPTPETIDPYQYRDSKGELRWTDTNELVAHNPNRTRYQDETGTWRWTDTDQPVDQTDETYSADSTTANDHAAAPRHERSDLVEQWGAGPVEYLEANDVDPTLIGGDLTSIFQEVVPQAQAGDTGFIGEIHALARWQQEGHQVDIPDRPVEDNIKDPDFLVNNTPTEVKTRIDPVSTRYIKDRISDANKQLADSSSSDPGRLEIQLEGDAADVGLQAINRQIRGQFNAERGSHLGSVAVYCDDVLLVEWIRDTGGSVSQVYP
jgi:hypothetical protein